MKKATTFLLSLCVCFLAATFAGCDFESSVHTHAYRTEWSYDENDHWRACEGCAAVFEKEEHAFVEGVCATCGYEKTTSPTPTPSTSWKSYFVFENVTVAKTTELDSGSILDCKTTEKLLVQGKQWLWQGTYDYYSEGTLYDSDSPVVYFDGKDAYENGTLNDVASYHKSEFLLHADFSAYESSFTQAASGVYEANEIKADGVTYKNARVTTENGKIASLSVTAEFFFGGTVQTEKISYVFSDWGKTAFDGTKYTTPSPWSTYFLWANVTVCKTMTYDKDGTTMTSDLQTTWEIEGEKWLCRQDYMAVDGQVMTMTTVYYDGKKGYVDGEESENFEWYHCRYDGILGCLEGLESVFEKTEQSETTVLYTAKSITLYGVTTYANVQITVRNGRIVKIEYDIENAVMDGDSGEIYSGRCAYVFSDYGTTKIDYEIAA